MSNSNRNKTNSEGSNRHLYEPVKEVLHGFQEKKIGNFATDPPRSVKPLSYSQKAPQRGGNSYIIQWWSTLSSKHQIKKIKEWCSKQREESKEEALMASTSKPKASPPPQEGKRNCEP
ncbi:hypothetical protein O181_129413 [Austropuccinia psidii MF-1]|uniref:Uncharacterized protein n=1 Tax=Austropuccinia psidii MF-1 TaxID=1389203 RepID=A0A9Q3Q8T5_9BASI|nr:hypothetical protein [Austropuccinia psidii MF-1]